MSSWYRKVKGRSTGSLTKYSVFTQIPNPFDMKVTSWFRSQFIVLCYFGAEGRVL